MIRKNMAPYIVERLLFYKKGFEDLRSVSDLLLDIWKIPKVRILDFEFEFMYNLTSNNLGKLDIKISGFSLDARLKLKEKFEERYFPENVKLSNLIVRSAKFFEHKDKEPYYLIKTDLVSIHDKRTYESVLGHFVEPLVKPPVLKE